MVFSKIFNRRAKNSDSSIEENKYFKIRKDSFFTDENHHKHFLKHGWCKIENVVDENEINSFTETFDQIQQLEKLNLDKEFINTGCHVKYESRALTEDVIRRNVKTILPRFCDMNKVELQTGGSFVVKPAHQESTLETHQDSSFIDEESDYSLFIWIPFIDSNEENGTMSVLSGSHLWGNTQRGLCLPWNLEKHIPIMNQYMTTLNINRGDALVFDPALVHRSGPNLSDELRCAITLTVVRKNPEVIFFYKNEALPDNLVERYYVNENFFKSYDFESKPDESKWKKEVVEYKPFDLSEAELKSLIKQYHP